jgi:hypothetical protein
MRHVKVLLFSFAALIAISPLARADRAGFILGTNLARFSTDPDINASTDANFMFAGFAEFQVSDGFYIEPQLRYIEKGADVSELYTLSAGSDTKVTRTARYFEIPLHFKWKFRDGESFRPYVFGGPALAFKIGDSTKATSRSSGSALTTVGSAASLKGLDFSAELGGGLELFFTEDLSMRFAAAYSLGLLNINETSANWKTRGLQFYAGLGFAF